jgi:hypothetical protein
MSNARTDTLTIILRATFWFVAAAFVVVLRAATPEPAHVPALCDAMATSLPSAALTQRAD